MLTFLQCFKYIVTDPPRPLTEEDIWFQIGHVHEQQKDVSCHQIYSHTSPTNGRNYSTILQRQHTAAFWNETQTMPRSCSSSAGCIISRARVSVVKSTPSSTWKSLSVQVRRWKETRLLVEKFTKFDTDNSDAQSWYLLGRCYMSQQKYSKAYEAYQQAVYRDGRNPTFWCSIGVLYYQINQYRDALDAYSRAIRLNPYISEVWYDLGTLVCLRLHCFLYLFTGLKIH